jgi:hypothetical protein
VEKWHNVYGNLIISLQNNNPKFKKITYATYLAWAAKINKQTHKERRGKTKD